MIVRAPFHLLAKPAGPACNLDCSYCFYLRKEAMFAASTPRRMSDAVLEAFVRDYINAQDAPEIHFGWQGGEPTLLGVPFFENVLALQRRHAGGKRIVNALQTNGTLLDDTWGRFLREHGFLVGLSLDGPRALHDRHRRDKGDRPTFDRVMAGLDVLQRHAVDYNLLTVVSATNAPHAADVYRFLKSTGAQFLQFIPLVECATSPADACAAPPTGGTATPESVSAEQFGAFLCTIFDAWVRRDVGRVFVQAFDGALNQWLGLGASVCVHAEECGRALALEHNGDVFACDHYVYASHRRGNLLTTPLGELVDGAEQRAFGRAKSATLPAACRACRYRFACNGGCPKHRFARTPDGEPGLNHLCAGYRRFFAHIDAPMTRMAELLRQGRSAAEIMRPTERAPAPGRNTLCPCGSGRKFKHCCGR